MLDLVLQLPVCSKATEGNITLYSKISGDDGIVICLKNNGKYVWKFQDGKIYRRLMSTQNCGIKHAFCFLIRLLYQPVCMSQYRLLALPKSSGAAQGQRVALFDKSLCVIHSLDLGPSICLRFVGGPDENEKI